MTSLVELERQAHVDIEAALRAAIDCERLLATRLAEAQAELAKALRDGGERDWAWTDDLVNANNRAKGEIDVALNTVAERGRTMTVQLNVKRTDFDDKVGALLKELALARSSPHHTNQSVNHRPKPQDPMPAPSSTHASSLAHIDQLLDFHGEAFVNAVYFALLGRPVDETGLAHYMRRLRLGDSKPQVICHLARSAEGKRRAANIPGLKRLIAEQQRSRLWFWGALTRGRRLERRLERLDYTITKTLQTLAQMQSESAMHLNQLEHLSTANGNAHLPAGRSAASAPTISSLSPNARSVMAELDKSIAALLASNNLFYQGVIVRSDSPCLVMDHFNSMEQDFRWSEGTRSAILFIGHNDIPNSGILSFVIDTLGRQKIIIRLNGYMIFDEFIVGEKHAINVPVTNVKPGRNRIDFELPDARAPGAHDQRILAVALRSMTYSA